MGEWEFSQEITQVGGAKAHLLVLISPGQLWYASW